MIIMALKVIEVKTRKEGLIENAQWRFEKWESSRFLF